MDKGKKHVRTILSTMMFLMLLLATQTSAKSSIIGYLKCFGFCAAGCLRLPTSALKGLCAANCIRECAFGPNLQGLDYCKPVCVHDICIHHIKDADDLQKEDLDRYVNCVAECDSMIGECDVSSQPSASLVPAPSPF